MQVVDDNINPQRVVNVNVGIVGHVDSGKTSLVKSLSTRLSTAALDKNPQSQARGITLDLGFSAYITQLSQEHKKKCNDKYDYLQMTLVDCPGHASLIKTIIGGSHIIDMMILVVDVVKGIQAQTAECIVLAEITTDRILIVLNKIDLLPLKTKSSDLQQAIANIRKSLIHSKFCHAPIIPLSATSTTMEGDDFGLSKLVNMINYEIELPERKNEGDFYFAIDHCFAIKGKGTVVTGTVLSGSIGVNDIIEFPELKIERKIKSMQMFRRPVQQTHQGDRVGICVKNLDSKSLERGIAATPNKVKLIASVIVAVQKVRYFPRMQCKSYSRFHISVGHSTIMARVIFFKGDLDSKVPPSFSWDLDYLYLGEIPLDCSLCWALIQFDHPILCPPASMLIASRLDQEMHQNCRLAFYGRTSVEIASPTNALSFKGIEHLNIYKSRERYGVIDKCLGKRDASGVYYEVLGRDLFKKETNIALFLGLEIETSKGEKGVIHSAFGKSGKFKITFKEGTKCQPGDSLVLRFVKYIFNPTKKFNQPHVNKKESTTTRSKENSVENKLASCLKSVVVVSNEDKNQTQLHDDSFKDKAVVVVDEEEALKLQKGFIKKKETLKLQEEDLQLQETDRSDVKDKKTQVIESSSRSATLNEKVISNNMKQFSIREGTIERLKGETSADGKNPYVIASGLFNSADDVGLYEGNRVLTKLGEIGTLGKAFGKNGKVRVNFSNGTQAKVGDQVFLSFE